MVTTPIITFIGDANEPDVYVDVTDLPDPFTMNIPVGISNTHTATLYFNCSIQSPPGDYSVSSTNLGALAAGVSGVLPFISERAQPSLTAGEYDETLTFRVTAYTDAGYSSEYAHRDLSVTIHHFNHTDGSWAILYHDTFDAGGTDGWGGINCGLSPSYIAQFYSSPHSYLSACWQGSLRTWSALKEFTVGNYSKARMVLHYYTNQSPLETQATDILVDGVCKKQLNVMMPQNQWVRLAWNMFKNKTGTVYVTNQSYAGFVLIDEVWVIAK
jgi:hypothetical protein